MQLLITRAIIGVVCGFLVMLVVGWTIMYFEIDPPEPTETRYATILFFSVAFIVAVLGVQGAKAAALTVPVFLCCAGIVLMHSIFVAIVNQPDLNGDGIFTIRDLASAFLLVLTALGKWYSEMLFGDLNEVHPITRFLEVPVWVIAWPIVIGLTIFYWFMAIGWALMIVHWKPNQKQED